MNHAFASPLRATGFASALMLLVIFFTFSTAPAFAQTTARHSQTQNQDIDTFEKPTAEPLTPTGDAAPSVQELQSNGNITIRLSSNNIATFYPTYLENLSRTYVKLTGIDLEDDHLVDEFAAINYCELYAKSYKDEFTWRQARIAIRKIIQDNLESFPEYFYIDGTIKLGRYNFEAKAFEIDPRSRFQRTGIIRVVFAHRPDCVAADGFSNIPTSYSFRLTNPITLESIPVSEGTAYQLSRLMDQKNPHERTLNVSLFMRVNDFSNNNTGDGNIVNSTVRATLLTMRFYLDDEHKVFIYENKTR